jgi:hypothetical protein
VTNPEGHLTETELGGHGGFEVRMFRPDLNTATPRLGTFSQSLNLSEPRANGHTCAAFRTGKSLNHCEAF